VGAARHKLQFAGAHAVLDTLAELPILIADLDARLARGEKP
jgi:phosphonoacetaldehyde hydrolase